MKLAWAFEPNDLTTKQLKTMHAFISRFAANPLELEIIHVEGDVFAGMYDPSGTFYPVQNPRDIRRDVDRALTKAGIALPAQQIHLLNVPVSSISNSVHETLETARDHRVDAIALFTKGNRGLERFLMGSFSETMLHQSDIDLMLMSPKTHWSGQLKRVLYLDDFSEDSKKNLTRVIKLCRSQQACLTVFHVPHITYHWAFEEKNEVVQKYRRYVDQMKTHLEKTCARHEVDCEVLLGAGPQEISEAAFKIAKKKKTDLIVVAAKIGPIGALLGGSITRSIIRNSPLPVYVLKSEKERAKRKTAPKKRSGKKSVERFKIPPGERPSQGPTPWL